MKEIFRSDCPLASALDLIGDKWSLLIIRDMLLQGKKTFKEFSMSSEKIAPGILSSRLKWLASIDLITGRKLPENKKEIIYLLTEKGIDLAVTVVELTLWSDRNIRTFNPKMLPIAELGFNSDRSFAIDDIQNSYRDLVRNTLG